MKKRLLSLTLALCMVLVLPAFAVEEVNWTAYQESDFMIEDGVLRWCKKSGATKVKIPDGVVEIAKGAFQNGRLTHVYIPDSVKIIGDEAFFRNLALDVVLGGNGVEQVGEGAFASTMWGNEHDMLGSFWLYPITEYLDPNGNVGVNVPDGVKWIKEGTFEQTDYLISAVFSDSVVSIEDRAFFECRDLSSVIFGSGLEEIGVTAFAYTALTDVELPNGLTTIGFGAFLGCDGLKRVVIPPSVTEIGENAFADSRTDLKNGIGEGTPIQGLTICGAAGSYAESYANARGIPFEAASFTAQPTTPALTATPTASTVLVNGVPTAFDAYNIGGANYFKLRDLAFVLNGTAKQFGVDWDASANAISLTSGAPYTAVGGEMAAGTGMAQTATPTSSKILLNGAEVSLEAYNIGGNNYFKLRDLGSAFDFGVDWDGAVNTVVIDTTKGYTA